MVVANLARKEINVDVLSSAPTPTCNTLLFVTYARAVQLEYERMGYKRSGFTLEGTGSKNIFERFLGTMAFLAEEQPVAVLEVMSARNTKLPCIMLRLSLLRSRRPRSDTVYFYFMPSLAVQEKTAPGSGYQALKNGVTAEHKGDSYCIFCT